MKKIVLLFLILIKTSFASNYDGCLFFQDDLRPEDDQIFLKSLKPKMLIRSWYRFGEPHSDKAYEKRANLVKELQNENIELGGGISLSVVNDRDLERKDFDKSWLVGNEKDKKYATLSAAGFRRYLIKRLIEQVNLGVTELHLGETNGKVLKKDGTLSQSWHGEDGLATTYRSNLENFLKELKSELKKQGKPNVKIDIWGMADWMKNLSPSPDAVMTSPPDERWGFNWNTNEHYDIQKDRARIKQIMIDEMKAARPAQMIYIFDHPKPFYTDFMKLSDSRQAYLTKFFAELTREIGAKFVVRSYSEDLNALKPETRKVITEECHR